MAQTTDTGAADVEQHRRYLAEHAHLGAAFGSGSFGAFAERVARTFGTPQYLIAQTLMVIVWIAANGVLFWAHFDPYPFILLNLAFSTQAAYAAPLILLAQTRQADRDKAWSDADARHREEIAETTLALLRQNTDLTERLTRALHVLTAEIHGRVMGASDASR